MSGERMFATFVLGTTHYGVDALDVQEVLRAQSMTKVPLAPREVSGVINLRGQVVVAIDLRRRLALPASDDGTVPMNVVVRTSDGPVSLLVDEIGDVIEVPPDCLEDPPETLRDEERELLSGVCKLDGELILVIDVERTAAPMA